MNRSLLMMLFVGIPMLFSALFAREACGFAGRGIPNVVSGVLQSNAAAEGKLVYADFEQSQKAGERPVSSRGGLIQLSAYQESPTRPSRYKGAAEVSPPAPDLVRLQKDSPNKAASFDYELQAPNMFAGVGLEIHGLPDKDGKRVADDVSGYNFLALQLYVTGVHALRLEFVSQGQGINIPLGDPQATFKIESGFNTYRIPFKSLTQPFWAAVKVNPKEVLKKLTSIKLIVFCDNCTSGVKGTVVVDNIVFEK